MKSLLQYPDNPRSASSDAGLLQNGQRRKVKQMARAELRIAERCKVQPPLDMGANEGHTNIQLSRSAPSVSSCLEPGSAGNPTG